MGKEIDEIPEPPKLPYLKEFNCVSSPTFKRRSMSLNQNQLEKLKADVTLSMIMLTLYARTIAKWSQNKSFILNIPVFDRDPNIDIKIM